MKKIALLRGVTPVGKNKIPKMSYLADILTEAGLEAVQTYIQSGNIICESELSDEEFSQLIHDRIKSKIGADLSIIIKHPVDFSKALVENPFGDGYDSSRVHLVFTNDQLPVDKLEKLLEQDFGEEELRTGHACLYMYLPKDTQKKRLNTNYLEKPLGITATMRKWSVITRLHQMSTE